MEWGQLQPAAKIRKSSGSTMVETTSRELVVTVRSRKSGGWCLQGVVAQAGRRKGGGWYSQDFRYEDRRRVRGRLGGGEGDAK